MLYMYFTIDCWLLRKLIGTLSIAYICPALWILDPGNVLIKWLRSIINKLFNVYSEPNYIWVFVVIITLINILREYGLIENGK